MMNIASLLAAVNDPDRPAIIFSGTNESMLTFRGLDDLSSRLAAGMDATGLRAGERVIVLAPISPMLYAGLIALFKLGITAVFLDPQTGFRQLNRAVELADARAFIGTRRTMWLGAVFPALRRIEVKFITEGNGARSLRRLALTFSPRTKIAEVEVDHPALITFTGGGTDSSPRGVLRTHRLLIEQHRALSRILPVRENDVDMPAFPVATLHNLASGIPSVIPDFPFRQPAAVLPQKILGQIQQHGITTASGSPAYWSAIVKFCSRNKAKLPLRRIVMGGAPTSPNLMKQLSCIAPNAEVLNLYGSTEAEPVAVLRLEDVSDEVTGRIERGSGIPLGRSVPEACVRILDENRAERPVNQVGEIWVSGGHVARGYFSNPKADAVNKYLSADGKLWHCMGDVGCMDADGCLWLVGRVNTVIMRDGEPIHPIPAETIVETLAFVRRAALVGAADRILGERTVLFVEFSKDVSLPENWRTIIQSLLSERGCVADEIRPIRKLPVDVRHNARIDYQKLKEFFSRRRNPIPLWEITKGREIP